MSLACPDAKLAIQPKQTGLMDEDGKTKNMSFEGTGL